MRARTSGTAPDLLAQGEQAEDETDLVLGLDFGTSCVKAVIRDRLTQRAFAVPFTKSAENPYLLPSHVWLTNGRYSLDGGVEQKRDLKLGLLGCGVESPVDDFNDACGFLALVIRHCRGWLFDAHSAEYRRKRIQWFINLGLPSRSYEDVKLVRLFRRLAWASGNAAAHDSEQVTREVCDAWRQRARALYRDGEDASVDSYQFGPDDVDVVPEIAAQIFGLVSAANWDWRSRPMMMLIDVGAGTVDTAFFSFTKSPKGEARFAFFANDVQPSGVMNLHRDRVSWLIDAAGEHRDDPVVMDYLNRIRLPTDVSSVPESVHEYLQGFQIATRPDVPDIDTRFYRSVLHPQVASCPQQARRNGRIPDAQLERVPCFLAGGGSRMAFFRKVVDDVNRLPRNIRLERLAMSMPREELVCPGLRESDVDRLSVAFGLSHHGAGGRPLGKVVRTIDIPKGERASQARGWRDAYVDKDMT